MERSTKPHLLGQSWANRTKTEVTRITWRSWPRSRAVTCQEDYWRFSLFCTEIRRLSREQRDGLLMIAAVGSLRSSRKVRINFSFKG